MKKWRRKMMRIMLRPWIPFVIVGIYLEEVSIGKTNMSGPFVILSINLEVVVIGKTKNKCKSK